MARRQKQDSSVEMAAEAHVEEGEVNHRKGAFVTIRGAELKLGDEIVTVISRDGKAVKSYKVKEIEACGRKSLSKHVNNQHCYDGAGSVSIRA